MLNLWGSESYHGTHCPNEIPCERSDVQKIAKLKKKKKKKLGFRKYDPYSIRNFIPLCGSKDETSTKTKYSRGKDRKTLADTCHALFDTYHFCLLNRLMDSVALFGIVPITETAKVCFGRGSWIWVILLPSAVHLEERLTVSQSVPEPASRQSDRITQFGFFVSGRCGPNQQGGPAPESK